MPNSNNNVSRPQYELNDFYSHVMDQLCDKIKTEVLSKHGWSEEVIELKVNRMKELWQENLSQYDIYQDISSSSSNEHDDVSQSYYEAQKMKKLQDLPKQIITAMINPFEHPLVYDQLRYVRPERNAASRDLPRRGSRDCRRAWNDVLRRCHTGNARREVFPD